MKTLKFKGHTVIFCTHIWEYIYSNWFQCRHCGQWKTRW